MKLLRLLSSVGLCLCLQAANAQNQGMGPGMGPGGPAGMAPGMAAGQIPIFPPDLEALEQFPQSERDRIVSGIESFQTVLDGWERKSRTGNIMSTYQNEVIAEFEPGEPKFEPEPGKTYFYENTGVITNRFSVGRNITTAQSNRVVVGDAETKEVIAYGELAPELRTSVHTTVVSPDGSYVYIIGALSAETQPTLLSTTAMVKVDALTLEPVKIVTMGARLHHGQIFRDNLLLIDTFARADDGLDVFLYDVETDEIVGGLRDEDLGGSSYTSYTDGEYIYILMQPAGYGPRGMDAFVGASSMNVGRLTTMRPFWVARVNPDTWEVEQEYPYPGYRGDWIVIDSASEYMYVPAGGSSSVTKIDIETGAIAWHAAAGIGPYGATLNADESEIWVADKGETTGFMGRTVTVLDTASGRGVETVFAGYMIDHVLLAPNGREVWGTSNAEGVLYVFDTATREQMATIEMPGYGDAHGLVWVHYDENGDARVVRDQGGFHGGLDPAEGIFLDY